MDDDKQTDNVTESIREGDKQMESGNSNAALAYYVRALVFAIVIIAASDEEES